MRGKFLACAVGLLVSTTSTATLHAGDVDATIRGGNLYVYGDDFDNQIAISAPDNNGQIIVAGSTSMSGENTSVNGQENGTVVLDGWNGGIYCFLYDGDDSLTLSSAMVNGFVHIDLGEDNDSLVVGVSPQAQAFAAAQRATNAPAELLSAAVDAEQDAVIISSGLLVLGASGHDFVELQQLWVAGTAEVNLGSGNDDLLIGTLSMEETTVAFQESLVIIPGNERDWLELSSIDVGGDLIIDDATGGQVLFGTDIRVGRSVFIYGTPDNDRIDLVAMSVQDVLRVIAEGGNDIVIVAGTARATYVYAGAGNDKVRIVDLEGTRADVFLDAGHDDFMIQRGNLRRLNAYGGSGDDLFALRFVNILQAYLYGDAGTDSYQGVPGNNIGSLNLYSIENQ